MQEPHDLSLSSLLGVLPVTRRSVLTGLAVAFLAFLFCLALCGAATALEPSPSGGSGGDSEAAETVVPGLGVLSGDLHGVSVPEFSTISGDVLSSDLTSNVSSVDVLSQPLHPELTVSDDVSSCDVGSPETLSEDYPPGEPSCVAPVSEDVLPHPELQSVDAFLRDLLSGEVVPARMSSVDAEPAHVVSLDVVSGDVFPERAHSEDRPPDPFSDDLPSGDIPACSISADVSSPDFSLSVPASGDVSAEILSDAPSLNEESSRLPVARSRTVPAGPVPEDFPEGLLTADRVNLRAQPGVTSKVLDRMGRGERLRILKEWMPPVRGEGVLTRPCRVDVDGETVRLPDGFGVTVTGVDEKAGTVRITFRHRDGWAEGRLARDAVSSMTGEPWMLVLRQDGSLGWAFGRYVDVESGPAEGPPPEVRALHDEAVSLLEEGRDGEALFRLDQVLEAYPGHVDALFERGRCLAIMGRYEEAIGSFWEIAFYAPSHPRYLAWTGHCYEAVRRFDPALQAYSAALILHPDHAIALSVKEHAGRCRARLGQPEAPFPDEEQARSFVFGRWDEWLAEEIWEGSTRGRGLWETW